MKDSMTQNSTFNVPFKNAPHQLKTSIQILFAYSAHDLLRSKKQNTKQNFFKLFFFYVKSRCFQTLAMQS